MKHVLFLLLVILSVAFLSGCVQEPKVTSTNQVGQADSAKTEKSDQFKYHPDTEVPEGPGILTGKTGEFKVFDK